jgi:hypothetical protein
VGAGVHLDEGCSYCSAPTCAEILNDAEAGGLRVNGWGVRRRRAGSGVHDEQRPGGTRTPPSGTTRCSAGRCDPFDGSPCRRRGSGPEMAAAAIPLKSKEINATAPGPRLLRWIRIVGEVGATARRVRCGSGDESELPSSAHCLTTIGDVQLSEQAL